MANITRTIVEPANATMDIEVRLRRYTQDGVTTIQVTALARVGDETFSATWDPRDDVDAVKNNARDFLAAVIASAKSRWGF